VGARIMDLQDPSSKMSTTSGSEAGTVYVLDEPAAVTKKLKSAVTDSGREVARGPGKEGVENLIEILSVVAGTDADAIEAEFEGKGYGDFKGAVAEAVVEYLRPVRERYDELRGDTGELERVLAAGADGAREIAATTLADVRDAMGVAEPRS
jgi:tryptophanyl-tRNA synthetase